MNRKHISLIMLVVVASIMPIVDLVAWAQAPAQRGKPKPPAKVIYKQWDKPLELNFPARRPLRSDTQLDWQQDIHIIFLPPGVRPNTSDPRNVPPFQDWKKPAPGTEFDTDGNRILWEEPLPAGTHKLTPADEAASLQEHYLPDAKQPPTKEELAKAIMDHVEAQIEKDE